MPTTYNVFRIVDTQPGGDTIDLMSGSGYSLVTTGWAPNVSRMRSSPVGALGAFAEVDEEITINVYAPDATSLIQLQARLATMVARIDGARGNVDAAPIYLIVQPAGSINSEPLYTVITGGSKSNSILQLPASFYDKNFVGEVEAAKLRFSRHGLWYQMTAEQVTLPATLDYTFDLSTATFSDNRVIPAPVSVGWTGVDSTILPLFSAGGYIAVARSPDCFLTFDADHFYDFSSTVPEFSAPTEPLAYGGSYLQYKPVSGNAWVSTPDVDLGVTFPFKRVAVFATVRVISSDGRFLLRSRLTSADQTKTGQPIFFDGSTLPTTLMLGTMSLVNGLQKFGLDFYSKSAGADAHLDIDRVIFVAMDDLTSRIISLDPVIQAGMSTSNASIRTTEWQKTGLSAVQTLHDTIALNTPTLGASDLVTTGNKVSFMLMGMPMGDPMSSSAQQQWYGSLGYSIATRSKGYLVPE